MSENTFREVLLYGEAAAKAVFAVRPKAIRRAWFDKDRVKHFADIVAWMAAEKLSYSVGVDADLRAMTGHARHDGVALLTDRPPFGAPKLSDLAEWRESGEPAVFVTNTPDARQIATIARVSVAMGVKRMLLDDASFEAAHASAAWSDSGGAMEFLRIFRVTGAAGFLKLAAEKFHIVGAVREGGRNPDYTTPVRVPGRPPMLLIGDGPNGIAQDLIARCAHTVHIPVRGDAPVELNAADTAAHFLPWLTAKTKKNPGEGFRTRQKEAKAAKETARRKSAQA